MDVEGIHLLSEKANKYFQATEVRLNTSSLKLIFFVIFLLEKNGKILATFYLGLAPESAIVDFVTEFWCSGNISSARIIFILSATIIIKIIITIREETKG